MTDRELIAVLIAELRHHQYCGDCYPENGWPSVNNVLAKYRSWVRKSVKAAEIGKAMEGGQHGN